MPQNTLYHRQPLTDGRFATFAKSTAALLSSSELPIARRLAEAYRMAISAPLHPRNALQDFPPASPQLKKDICDLTKKPPTSAAPLMNLIAPIAPYLQWRAAGGGKNPALGAVELIGPCGIALADTLRGGLFYQPPNYHYPRHMHAAEECYVQLCGGGVWHADARAPIAGAGGVFVHHRSWQPHALITDAQPLLAVWGWDGDIDMGSYAMCD